MSTFLGILIAILAFGVMIFLHELGHYLAARLCKVKVLEFAVGMGPKIFSRTSKKTGIKYSLRILPIGGYTSMLGEDATDESEPQEDGQNVDLTDPDARNVRDDRDPRQSGPYAPEPGRDRGPAGRNGLESGQE